MPTERLFSLTNSWFRVSVGITAALVIVIALAGFILLPYAQSDLKLAGLWDAICSAAGIPKLESSASAVPPAFKSSDVIMTSAMLANPTSESIGRGATLAQQCAICHGPTGISRADSPNLAGQYPAAIYKQLKDFKSGARANAIMSPFTPHLTDQDMVDLSAYYHYLPRLPAYHPAQKLPAPRIVVNGAPMRGIAPCGSCHGSLDNKAGSPWLEGQSAVYMKAQLHAFAHGTRRNDISQQMRNVARAMTDEEIEEAANYYASQPPDEYGISNK